MCIKGPGSGEAINFALQTWKAKNCFLCSNASVGRAVGWAMHFPMCSGFVGQVDFRLLSLLSGTVNQIPCLGTVGEAALRLEKRFVCCLNWSWPMSHVSCLSWSVGFALHTISSFCLGDFKQRNITVIFWFWKYDWQKCSGWVEGETWLKSCYWRTVARLLLLSILETGLSYSLKSDK